MYITKIFNVAFSFKNYALYEIQLYNTKWIAVSIIKNIYCLFAEYISTLVLILISLEKNKIYISSYFPLKLLNKFEKFFGETRLKYIKTN